MVIGLYFFSQRDAFLAAFGAAAFAGAAGVPGFDGFSIPETHVSELSHWLGASAVRGGVVSPGVDPA